MENRSYALMAGIFTLALIAVAVVVAIWLEHGKTAVVMYDIVSQHSVGGLSVQSPVRFQGVPVGHVESMTLDQERPGRVLIRIAVKPTTPITDETWAELDTQGITGLGVVALHDAGMSTHLLLTSAAHPARIPLRPGLLERLEEKSSGLLDELDQAAVQINALLSPQNTQALSATLQNAAQISAQLKEASGNVGPLIKNLSSAAAQAGDAAQQASAAVARLAAPDGVLASATQSLRQIGLAAARLNTQTLPDVSDMAGQVSATAHGASAILRRVGEAPQSLLFGPPSAQPGPGEAGFAGFGEKR
ncbi:MAG: MlaD family protein [Bordetella sp.]|uniref:MlaD family protein n=1 Tax=Bordetella sp. TaxID=28081 RepID=UPI003F7B9F00